MTAVEWLKIYDSMAHGKCRRDADCPLRLAGYKVQGDCPFGCEPTLLDLAAPIIRQLIKEEDELMDELESWRRQWNEGE